MFPPGDVRLRPFNFPGPGRPRPQMPPPDLGIPRGALGTGPGMPHPNGPPLGFGIPDPFHPGDGPFSGGMRNARGLPPNPNNPNAGPPGPRGPLPPFPGGPFNPNIPNSRCPGGPKWRQGDPHDPTWHPSNHSNNHPMNGPNGPGPDNRPAGPGPGPPGPMGE